jgi:D-aminopeptidase
VGGSSSNGSGDYVIAFSTHKKNRIKYSPSSRVSEVSDLHNDAMSPLFVAVQEATEEAILNSMFKAATITGRNGRSIEALPIKKTMEILKKYNALNWGKKIPHYRISYRR